MFLSIAGTDAMEAFNAASRTMKTLQPQRRYHTDDAFNWSEVHDVKLQALEEIIEEARYAGAGGVPLAKAIWPAAKAFPKGKQLTPTLQTPSATGTPERYPCCSHTQPVPATG